jgi:hypothetical protein
MSRSVQSYQSRILASRSIITASRVALIRSSRSFTTRPSCGDTAEIYPIAVLAPVGTKPSSMQPQLSRKRQLGNTGR